MRQRDPRTAGLDDAALAFEDDLVNLALPGREDARNGQGPGDVAGIAAEFGSDVDRHHLAGVHPAGVFLVMEDERIRARADDRGETRPRGAERPELVLDHALEVRFEHPGPEGGQSRPGGLGR